MFLGIAVLVNLLIGLVWAIWCVARNRARGYHGVFRNTVTFVFNFFFWWIGIPVSAFSAVVLGRDYLIPGEPSK